jgi:hypothetical protein
MPPTPLIPGFQSVARSGDRNARELLMAGAAGLSSFPSAADGWDAQSGTAIAAVAAAASVLLKDRRDIQKSFKS